MAFMLRLWGWLIPIMGGGTPTFLSDEELTGLMAMLVIMALMCQGRLEFESIALAHLIQMPDYLKTELQELAELQKLGLCELTADAVQVTPTGWYFVRAVAMVFDRHLRLGQARERFSRII